MRAPAADCVLLRYACCARRRQAAAPILAVLDHPWTVSCLTRRPARAQVHVRVVPGTAAWIVFLGLAGGGLVQYRRITTAVLALVSVAFVAACSDDDTDNPVGTGNNNTTVRFFNATTGSLNLDIAQNGSVGTGNGNITFGNASSCIRVNNANPQLAVRQAGSTTSLT